MVPPKAAEHLLEDALASRVDRAGRLAGAAARAVAGPTRSPLTADRAELIHDALTALVALRSGATIVTSDSDFDLFMQLEPELEVVFYG